MKKKVFEFIDELHMIEEKDRILVGVSGGADSMCLFWLLLEYTKKVNAGIVVVHVNHCIRGAEAERDEAFVTRICKEQQVVFEAVRADIPKLAHERQLSEEECGRNERYRIFSELSVKYGCNKTAVAHNKNDAAETVLFNLIRGTGLKGVTGIRPMRGNLIRPLLCVERREIEAYMSDNNYKYCTDSTNLAGDYTRNRIRSNILQYAAENINAEAVEHIYSFAKKAEEIENYLACKTEMIYNQLITDKNGRLYLRIDDFLNTEQLFQKEVIRLCIGRMAGKLKDIEAVHIESILELLKRQTGRQISIPYGITVKKEYENLVFFNEVPGAEAVPKVIKVSFNGKTNEEYGIDIPYFNKKLRLRLYNYKKGDIIPGSENEKWFDYDKLPVSADGAYTELEIRSAEDGDTLQIGRTHGTKRIKDYFKDIKISSSERKHYPLLTCKNKVLWVIGKRSGEAFLVDEDTKTVLIAELL